MIPLIWTALGVAILLAAIYLGLCALLVLRFLRRAPDDPDRLLRQWEGTPQEKFSPIVRRERAWYQAQPKEQVWIESFDGLRLHGCLIPCPQPRGTILLVHGFHSSGYKDFGCVMRAYHQMGFQLLVIDQRAHLESQGKYLTMGVRERQDVRSWAIFLLERFGQSHRVVLGGLSMGASTVLMASGLDLPPNVIAVIADCGYTTPRAIFRDVMVRWYHLPTWLLGGAELWCRLLAGFSMDGTSAVEAVKHTQLPLLLIHGDADDFVPSAMAREIYAAAEGQAQLVLIPEAGHGMSYLVDQPQVSQKLTAFLDKHCPKEPDAFHP